MVSVVVEEKNRLSPSPLRLPEDMVRSLTRLGIPIPEKKMIWLMTWMFVYILLFSKKGKKKRPLHKCSYRSAGKRDGWLDELSRLGRDCQGPPPTLPCSLLEGYEKKHDDSTFSRANQIDALPLQDRLFQKYSHLNLQNFFEKPPRGGSTCKSFPRPPSGCLLCWQAPGTGYPPAPLPGDLNKFPSHRKP